MNVCCECCVLSGRGLCDELITHPEESYRLWCVVVCDPETSWMRRPWPNGGRKRQKSNKRTHKRMRIYSYTPFTGITTHHIILASTFRHWARALIFFSFKFRLEVHSETHSTYSSHTRDAGLPFKPIIIQADAQLVKIHIFFVPLVSKVFVCIVRPFIWLTTIKTLLYGVGLASWCHGSTMPL